MKLFDFVFVCFFLGFISLSKIKGSTDEYELDLMRVSRSKWKVVGNTIGVYCSSISADAPIVVAPGCGMELTLNKSSFISTFQHVHESNTVNNYDSYLFQLRIGYSIQLVNIISDINSTMVFKTAFYPYFSKDISIGLTSGTENSFQFIFPVIPSNSSVSSVALLSFSLASNILNSSSEYSVEEKLETNLASLVVVTIESISLRYLLQPSKLSQLPVSNPSTTELPDLPDFSNSNSVRDHFQKYCQLLGTVHSVILNQISIGRFRLSYHQFLSHRKNPSLSHPYDFYLSDTTPQTNSYPRILCGIYTISTHESRIKTIFNTWGKKCHQIIFFSNHTNEEYHTIPIYPYGEENYGNMFQKTIAMIKYIYKHYIQELDSRTRDDNADMEVPLHEKVEFDWFLFGGDDLYVIVDNLFSYLQVNEIIQNEMHVHRKPLYIGRKLTYPTHLKNESYPRPVDFLQFHSGGSGYLLNVYAVKALGTVFQNLDVFDENYNKENDECLLYLTTSEEDYYIANCLKSLNITAFDTGEVVSPEIGEVNQTSLLHRFHIFPPGFYYHFDDILKDSWLYDYDNSTFSSEYFSCSNQSISFHYIDSLLMKNMHNFLYRCSMEVKYSYYVFHNNSHNYFDDDIYMISN
jgi:hypothetical protein